ncbi:hypothetical protein [Iodobacter fluviatilis]|uniref:Uncharacterized protein n=1 Tax=Iodobacter fluviatilis TaxID=537 RepID=A0A377Q8D7_9NEIS|nr:hypothetical protein [Iodobacter fluviatilis]TCU81931.1 hypothetical protein EV682_11852 [Iodobacter fluviatilis]STQ91536.1 Uncharacterised protein [Iodobacter fluviatilis]
MDLKFVWMAVLFLASAAASAETYNTEENPLFIKLPARIEKALYGSKENAEFFKDSGCKVVGVAIGLKDSQKKDAYVVATRDGCGWGSAGGSVWIVQDTGSAPGIVLDGFGVSITLNDKIKNGFRTISTLEGNAGSCSKSFYEHSGKGYSLVKGKGC